MFGSLGKQQGAEVSMAVGRGCFPNGSCTVVHRAAGMLAAALRVMAWSC